MALGSSSAEDENVAIGHLCFRLSDPFLTLRCRCEKMRWLLEVALAVRQVQTVLVQWSYVWTSC